MFYLSYRYLKRVLGRSTLLWQGKEFHNRWERNAWYYKIRGKVHDIKVWDDIDRKSIAVDNTVCSVKGIELHLHFDNSATAADIGSLFCYDVEKIAYGYKKCIHNKYSVLIPNQSMAIDKLRKTTEFNFDNDTSLNKQYKVIKHREEEVERVQKHYVWDDRDEIKEHSVIRDFWELSGYQSKAVVLLQRYKSFGLFWEHGTGKRPPAIVGSCHHKKTIVGVPYGLEDKWKSEYKVWSRRKDIFILPTNLEKRKAMYKEFGEARRMILIAPFNTLEKDSAIITEAIKSFDMLILDEPLFLCTEENYLSNEILKLRNLSAHALVLVRTPVKYEMNSVFPFLNFLYPKMNFTKEFISNAYFRPKVKESRAFWSIKYEDKINEEIEDMWFKMIHTYIFEIKASEVGSLIPRKIREI